MKGIRVNKRPVKQARAIHMPIMRNEAPKAVEPVVTPKKEEEPVIAQQPVEEPKPARKTKKTEPKQEPVIEDNANQEE